MQVLDAARIVSNTQPVERDLDAGVCERGVGFDVSCMPDGERIASGLVCCKIPEGVCSVLPLSVPKRQKIAESPERLEVSCVFRSLDGIRSLVLADFMQFGYCL